jgi:hypothetical protein
MSLIPSQTPSHGEKGKASYEFHSGYLCTQLSPFYFLMLVVSIPLALQTVWTVISGSYIKIITKDKLICLLESGIKCKKDAIQHRCLVM